MDDSPKVPRIDLSDRLNKLNDKLDELETRLEKSLMEIQDMQAHMEQLESSFLDEIAQSAKTKFDNFRDYLASKIKP